MDELIRELGAIRRLLQTERRSLAGTLKTLKKQNQQLRDDKRALLDYIKELEKFNVDRADLQRIKEIFFNR